MVALILAALSDFPTARVRADELPRGGPTRGTPSVSPIAITPHFSSPPVDAEFFRSHAFEEPLIPTAGVPDVREDTALAALIMERVKGHPADPGEGFATFLLAHPNSRWRAALQLDLGIVYRHTGYFNRALTSWEEAWTLLKNETDPRRRALGDRAVGELGELNARLGRYDRLETLFAEIADRDVRGPASEKVASARSGLGMMNKEPEKAFLCGPLALDQILKATRGTNRGDPRIQGAKSTRQGTSLRQMSELAATVGLGMQMARRVPGAGILVPALIHWKVGHFAALVREANGRLLIRDPTFGDEMWISRVSLDEEASGFALVPEGPLPDGWSAVSEYDAGSIWGKGFVELPDKRVFGQNEPSAGQKCGKGMASYMINLLVVNLHISDKPLGYSPAFGPALDFIPAYNQREYYQPQLPLYSNLGPKWTFDWLSYLQDDPQNLDRNVDMYARGGGVETYQGLSGLNGVSAPHYRSRAVLVRTSSTRYERRMSDGGLEIYAQPDGSTSFPRRVFLTESMDAQGNRLTLTYSAPASGELRLDSVTDATGKVTTLGYDNSDPLKITKVTDPYGRFTTLEYDNAGRLFKITDVIGIVSQFTYGAADFITGLTTPYGTTSFATGESGVDRWVEATDPVGGRERVAFTNINLEVAAQEAVTPSGMPLDNNYLVYRNTFYWDKAAMATADPAFPPPYSTAHIFHWNHGGENFSLASPSLESEKPALESRIWYAYPGQASPVLEGSATTPVAVGRVLDDGNTQLHTYEYNVRGAMTREIDPVGRETVYVYGTDNVPDADPATGTGIDLLQVKVQNAASPGGWDVTSSSTYNSQHQPLTTTDASGQTTTYTYNAAGQPLTVVVPPHDGLTVGQRTTTYSYDTNGILQNVTGPASGLTTTYTYDSHNRVRTATDPDSYTVTYDYDTFDRPTKTTYPDGTFEETQYDRLDIARRRDRLGRWTHIFHDPLRRVTATRDPAGRTVTQVWCACGSLEKVVDANGNATRWERDVQGRVTKEIREDGTFKSTVYETTTSRVKKTIDAKRQEIHRTYDLDDKPLSTTHANAEHATPDVVLGYVDPVTGAPDAHGRVRQMIDGTGTTQYAYLPFGGLGAGQLASVDGPLPNDTVSYTYDELGRTASRTLNGVTSAWHYDQLGRLQTESDPLGTFSYAYDGVTGRVTTVTYPNGQTSGYSYFGNEGEHRLQEIHHRRPNASTLSKFGYTYDAVGNITAWTQQTDNNPSRTYGLEYDGADQLTAALLGQGTAMLKRYYYAYDPAGNRVAEQIDDVATGAAYDKMNRLVRRQGGGALHFQGTVSEPASVTVAGQPATAPGNGTFSASWAVPPGGTVEVEVKAKDPSGNVRTNVYAVGQSSAATDLTYDSNGNLTSDGSKTYEWDAENRLTRVCSGACQAGTDPANMLARFTYDGIGQRATKVAGGVATSFVYDGQQILEDRTSTATRRFVYGPGVDRPMAHVANSTVTYYVADHLGSIVRTTDSSGSPTFTREYDPWGRPIQGSTTSGYSFTGREWDLETALYYYRARYYDPDQSRFISEDLLGAFGGTRYTYVGNRPVGLTDPEGLAAQSPSGPFIAPKSVIDANFKLISMGNQYFIGDGECVTLTRELTGAPHTSTWRAGKKVMGNAVEWGTAIATFDANGRYPKDRKNSGVYLDQDPVKGILVLEQFPMATSGVPGYVHVRRIRPKGFPAPSNDAYAYSVVCAGK